MKKIAAYLLIIIAIALTYMGISNSSLPPTLSGIGFLLIAISFLKE